MARQTSWVRQSIGLVLIFLGSVGMVIGALHPPGAMVDGDRVFIASLLLVLLGFRMFPIEAWRPAVGCPPKPPKEPRAASDATKTIPPVLEKSIPRWFIPAGCVSLIVGLLAFCASAAVGGGAGPGDSPGVRMLTGLVAGALNPLFFVGFPLGMYWLIRGSRRPSKPFPITKSVEDNPKLTHCPDCGGHVSRLAATCPHCGRPLTPETPTI